MYYGGRGGGKSHSIARAILARCMAGSERVFCGREVQKSINDSVHQLFTDLIRDMRLSPDVVVVQNTRILFPETGSQITYGGLLGHTVDAVKSMEGCSIAWIEEAQRVSQKSWDLLIPTIRANDSEIWVSYNPDLESDPTHQRFVINTPPDTLLVKVGWQDNPYFNDVLTAEKDYLASVDMEAYNHIWEGECKAHSDAQVFKGKYIVERFEPEQDWHRHDGADWGFSQDPTAYNTSYIKDNKLYIRYEARGIQVEMDHLPALFKKVPQSDEFVIRADNARPETISYMNRHGFPRMLACKKYAGCVEEGIEFMRSFEQIVIHPDCVGTIEEFKLYNYKTDKLTGDILPALEDKHNHHMDAIRYSLEPHIGQRKTSTVFTAAFM